MNNDIDSTVTHFPTIAVTAWGSMRVIKHLLTNGAI